MQRYFVPLAPYLLITFGLSLCMYVFYTLKREMASLRSRLEKLDAQHSAAASETEAQIGEMREELREAEQRTAQLVPPAPPKSGLNLSMRTQVIRMFRHGEDAETIATRLSLPRNEVLLLLKVHKIAVSGQAAGDVPAAGSPYTNEARLTS